MSPPVRVDPDALGTVAAQLAATADELGRMAVATQAVLIHPAVVWAGMEHPVELARTLVPLEGALWGPRGLAWVAAGHVALAAEVAAQLTALRLAEVGAATLAALDTTAGHALDLGLRNADGVVLAGRTALDGWLPEGRGVARAATAPGVPLPDRPTVADLYQRVATLPTGELEVASIAGPDGLVRYVVLLRGIQMPFNATVNTPAQALKTSDGANDAYGMAVADALHSAGVPTGAELMLVGHSQGGIAAVNLAAGLRQYRVSHVIAAGSPVANKRIPAGTRLLRIENRGDFVPQLDASREHGGVRYRFGRERRLSRSVRCHELGTGYLPELVSPSGRFATDPEVRLFLAGAARYLEGTPGESRRFRLDAGPYGAPAAVRLAGAAGRVLVGAPGVPFATHGLR